MFGYRDNNTLTVLNMYDRDNNIIPGAIKLPVKMSYDIPENILRASVFEYSEGNNVCGYESFNIYVGNLTTLKQIIDSKNFTKRIEFRTADDEVPSIDTTVCYFDQDDVRVIFAAVKPGDIVVGDKEEFKSVVDKISENFAKIKQAQAEIRGLGYIKRRESR